MRKLFKLLAIAGAAGMAPMLVGATAVEAADYVVSDKGADIKPLCGKKPMKVALVDGVGSNTWRKIAVAEFKDELSKCSNVTDVLYADSLGDQQKYNSDLNSMASMGVNVLVTFTDYGDAALPAYRSAYDGGSTVVVPYYSKISGTPGQDFSVNVYQDQAFIGKLWADWVNKTLGGKGNIVMLGGTPGATSSEQFLDGLKEGLKPYPGIKMLDENYIVTNWNPADAQRAVAGLIAKYPQIDAIVSDSGMATIAATKAYEQAGLPIPPEATINGINEMGCRYEDLKAAGKGWKHFAVDGATSMVRFAVRAGVAAYQETASTEPTVIVPYVYADTEAGKPPRCNRAAPPDADLSSTLSEDKLKAVFK
ncbi:substrate-binding domain-containing protein [Rhizobium multihospitium]|uniref:Ribose transport system substrate-binding protein n=1 Tax=Rhizobium multihospitium TaxID=410764 RepID=A0A1C3X3J5_9HYPH|nr:substrate-binding domain-containing protein [Rhizobium multihospitium]SCB46801.1 ribose transport system substrate-binding protein [Rhizobium multihospitium]